MDLTNETPSKSKNTVKKVRRSSINCDSPLRLLPNVSTPPSRFSKIFNPFEAHLLQRLHLPTFSPTVFAQVSTPKNDEKFRWTIDDISSLKPADIDEATVSQHVSEHDPMLESLVQEKITKFFSDKAIVPSPINDQQVQQVNLVMTVPKAPCTNSSVQTVLSLPPILPKHVEEALAPYFTYTHDQQSDVNGSLYRQLFEFDDSDTGTPKSSPALSIGMSPIQLSPVTPTFPQNKCESSVELPELNDCTLSPIGRSYASRSACRLSFSGHMSVDASMAVPDVNKSLNFTDPEHMPLPQLEEVLSESTVNWDMEYKHVSILSSSPEPATPHSKIFTSQRKRLSRSFKDEDLVRDIEMEDVLPKRMKNKISDVTDPGYQTGNSCETSGLMFASTPTKKN